MNLLSRMLARLSNHLPCRLITGADGSVYMERYHVLRVPGLCHVMLHRFRRSDSDEGVHDHPWALSASLVLTEGYHEQRLDWQTMEVRERDIPAGAINVIAGHDAHRIVLRDGTAPWTLFVTGPRTKTWGFYRPIHDGSWVYAPMTAYAEAAKGWWTRSPRGLQAAMAARKYPGDVVREAAAA